MARVIALELEIHGSHGIQAFRYDAALALIESGRLQPEKMIGRCFWRRCSPLEIICW